MILTALLNSCSQHFDQTALARATDAGRATSIRLTLATAVPSPETPTPIPYDPPRSLENSSRSLLAVVENNQIETRKEPSRTVYHQAIERPGKLEEILKPRVILRRSHQVGNLQRCEPRHSRAHGAPQSQTLRPPRLLASRKLCSFRKIEKSVRLTKRAG